MYYCVFNKFTEEQAMTELFPAENLLERLAL